MRPMDRQFRRYLVSGDERWLWHADFSGLAFMTRGYGRRH